MKNNSNTEPSSAYSKPLLAVVISDFRLLGLGKNNSFTLSLLYTDKEMFWATSEMVEDRFNALFSYCKDNWKDKKIAEVKHDGLNQDGLPINPIVVNIREWDL
jgi:hypothetical protein